MSSATTPRRTVLALLVALVTAGLVATSAPASAIPFEGEPTATTCLRLVALDGTGTPGSPLFVSFGYALVLEDC